MRKDSTQSRHVKVAAMAKTQVNIVVAATSLAAIGAAWTGIARADAHAAAAKAALLAEAAAEEMEAAATGQAEQGPAPQVITVPVVGASGPTLSERLGAAPPIQLAPLAPIRTGSLGANGASALVPAPAATQPVVSAAPGVAVPPSAPALAAPAVQQPVAVPAPAVVAPPAPAPPAATKPKATKAS